MGAPGKGSRRKKKRLSHKVVTLLLWLIDHVISTGHNIKWDHFDILATGKSDLPCKIKETLLVSELQLKPSLNENVCSEKLFLY